MKSDMSSNKTSSTKPLDKTNKHLDKTNKPLDKASEQACSATQEMLDEESDEHVDPAANPTEFKKKTTLFNDLRRFKRKKISIFTFGGDIVQGQLLGYDEVANCVIETDNKKKTVVFGKCISLVCEGELDYFE